MKRIERIFLYVKDQTETLTPSDVSLGSGVTTGDVSEALNIQRSNASKDLNQLVREGLLEKTDGRPVKYVDKAVFKYRPLSKPVKSYREHSLVEKVNPHSVHKPAKKFVGEDIFKGMIGSTGSMRTPVEQAKAAILYPPKGLNCLITGATGSGKTYFAHAMFQFALLNHVIDSDKKLVVFNCADYAHNPELLMSHLFGYAEGAFTGANKAKEGIIHEADGSILFLDEVHRLPPEGQEMIFYFMDHGTYSRLGESVKNRRADVRIICATTENPTSSLLNTFVRRIPIIIQLPNFIDRPAKEKIDLLRVMISMEASRIQRKISLSEDVVKALIGSVSYGNVGQLKSNVQLVTARGFLNHMEQEELTITIDELTDSIKEGMMQLASNREALAELSKYLEPQMIVTPNESLVTIQSDSYELPYNLYEIIGDKAALLKEDGLEQEVINNFITTDINVHLKSFYKDHGFTFDTENKLAEIVDQRIIDVTKEIYHFARQKLNYNFQPNFIYAMSLHISSFLKRIQNGEERQHKLNENIRNMVLDYPMEFETAQEIKRIIEINYQMNIPEFETYYLAVLLISLRENKDAGRIGIVVAAHGKSTATSMVQVVSQLLNVDNLRAVDMPLEMQPKEALRQIITVVQEVNEDSGVILLVDMGSLATFSDEIKRQTGIEVRTVDMVTTPIVLETARKTTLIDTQLDTLYDSLKNFQGYADIQQEKEIDPLASWKKPVIVAICASGEGTAQRMKEMIEASILPQSELELAVLPIAIIDMKEQLLNIQEEYRVIAVTGITNPKIEAPFIPMETFFSGEAEAVIEQLLTESDCYVKTKEMDEQVAKTLCIDYMEQSFTFINPKKIIEPLWEFTDIIKTELDLQVDYTFYVNLVMHLAGALERVLRDGPLSVTEGELKQIMADPNYEVVMKANLYLKQTFRLELPIEEVYYIILLIQNTQLNQTQNTENTLGGIHKEDTLF
ncbi:sigma-54-dependent transcriptional regulator [Candidatus Enterococcus mansonii]|uniref:Sigma-54 factor interaction domain-containing protein n=1 Tax=Candidatus Enterococcus mansonii TaxID=1834181 RepID=A0A242CE51_9ENTE|nr:sigma-54-dependent transcriptional regulator [Enterococcus sp. 4G2_DIV0659]OTO08517.1 sigma-54 factor interaction domain-containing protein [Enterococcus sp. 4G2_DIV0659]